MSYWWENFAAGQWRDVTPPPSDTAAFTRARCEAMAVELAGRARDWCLEEGFAPNVSLEIASALALAIVAEGVRDREVFQRQLMIRAADCDTPEGLLGVVPAAAQLLRYLQSGPLTGDGPFA
jgi:hypothetical protein